MPECHGPGHAVQVPTESRSPDLSGPDSLTRNEIVDLESRGHLRNLELLQCPRPDPLHPYEQHQVDPVSQSLALSCHRLRRHSGRQETRRVYLIVTQCFVRKDTLCCTLALEEALMLAAAACNNRARVAYHSAWMFSPHLDENLRRLYLAAERCCVYGGILGCLRAQCKRQGMLRVRNWPDSHLKYIGPWAD